MQPTITIYHISTPTSSTASVNQSFLYSKNFYKYYTGTTDNLRYNRILDTPAFMPTSSVNPGLTAAESGGIFLYRIKISEAEYAVPIMFLSVRVQYP